MDIVKEIEESLEQATPGPWYAIYSEVFIEQGPIAKLWGEGPKGEFKFDNYENNAKLIANAPEWLRHLLSIISQKDKEIERLREALIREREDARFWGGIGTVKRINEVLEENPHVNP